MYDPTANTAIYSIRIRNNNDPTGKRFETLMTEMIKQFAEDENAVRQKSGTADPIQVIPYSKNEDIHHGTDIMFYDPSGFFGVNGLMRFDMTHNFSEKNNMPFICKEPTRIGNSSLNFYYGIRIGNPNENFKSPVIVIGFDMKPKEYKAFENNDSIQEAFHKETYEILNMSNDILQGFYYAVNPKYRTKIDANPEYDIFPDTELITPNPKYLSEVSKYVSKNWILPENTDLNKNTLKLLCEKTEGRNRQNIEQLQAKYQLIDEFTDSVNKIEEDKELNQ